MQTKPTSAYVHYSFLYSDQVTAIFPSAYQKSVIVIWSSLDWVYDSGWHQKAPYLYIRWRNSRPLYLLPQLLFNVGAPTDVSDLSYLEELTIEANPGTWIREKIAVLKDRLSIVGSLSTDLQWPHAQADYVQSLERWHLWEYCQSQKLVLTISRSILIYAPPQADYGRCEINVAARLLPWHSHMSLYSLILENHHTVFMNRMRRCLCPRKTWSEMLTTLYLSW